MEFSIITLLLVGIFIFLLMILLTLQSILRIALSVASTYIRMFELYSYILKGPVLNTEIDTAQKERG